MILLIFGIIAPIIFVLAVIIGGIIQPKYDPRDHTVSELMSLMAPHRKTMILAFSLYAIFIILFGIGMLQSENTLFGKSGVIIILTGSLGLVMSIFFPADTDFAKRTTAGIVHTMMASIIAFFTVTSMLLVALGTNSKGFRLYYFISTALAFCFWAFTAKKYFDRERYAGLLQRIAIGLFLQWLFVFSLMRFV